MPKPGLTNFTVKTEDAGRLLQAAKTILGNSPVKAEELSPAKQLRLLLDDYERIKDTTVKETL